jgi:mannitol/fructose-specific phosphotransferase system IIA component (Ntr-type)
MVYQEIIRTACLAPNLKSDTKHGVIAEMLDMLCAAGLVKDRAAAWEALLMRERKMSTGMQYGVAIPHGKTDTVSAMVSAIALKKEGVEFDALDGEPSRIFVMTLSPPTEVGPHMRYLSEICKLLNVPEQRNRLLASETVEAMMEVLTGYLPTPA